MEENSTTAETIAEKKQYARYGKWISIDDKLGIILIVVIIVLLAIIYIFGGGLGFALAVIDVVIIYGLIYKYVRIDNLRIIGAVTIAWLIFVVILYVSKGSFFGLVASGGLIGGILLVAIALAFTSDSYLENLRGTGYRSGTSNYQKTCVVCGRRLVTGRKYCYLHKPWKQRSSTEYYEEEPREPQRKYPNVGATARTGGNHRDRSFEDYVGNQDRSYEDLVGKRKKRRYF